MYVFTLFCLLFFVDRSTQDGDSNMSDPFMEFVGRVENDESLKMMTSINMGKDIGE